jgi:hypothetical protein
MRSIQTFPVAVLFSTVLMLGLAGCVLKPKQQAKVVTPPPPPPKPAEPPPRPQPLSIAQTQTQLPSPQPISPEALATVQTPRPTAETESNPATNSRPGRRAGPVVGPKPESAVGAATVAGQSTAAPPPATPAAAPIPPSDTEPRATVQEIVPPAEQKRLQESVAAHQQEIHKVLEAALTRQLTSEQRGLKSRIESFLQQSEDAAKRNDWRQANTLAERAQVLAKELNSAEQ